MTKVIFVIALLGVVASCNWNNNQYTNKLKNLDSQLDENPGMVWDSLKKMDTRDFSLSQKAYYYLLNASATDKNYVYLEKDSTLRVALEYYQDKKDYYNLARCQYYMGKYVKNKQQLKTAYNLFKQSELNLKQSSEEDPHLVGLIYYQLGLILKQQNNHLEAGSFFQNSYDAFIQAKDTVSASYSLRYKGALKDKEFTQAKQDLFKSLELISKLKDSSEKVYQSKAGILSAISFFYIQHDSLKQSLEYSQKCLPLFLEQSKEVPSQYYWNILRAYYKQQQLDSARYYCNIMIESAKKEKSILNLISGYRTLSILEEKEGNFQKACQYKNYFNKLKDSLNKAVNTNNILDLERKYNHTETQRQLLKAENNNLRAYAIFTVIVFGLLSIGLPLYNRHKKLKLKYNKLSETIKHTEWGFLVTKEFITENHIAYDELERMLNREKSLDNINSDLYNKFHEALIQQKANYSGRLFDRLTSFDGNFGTKFQKLFPEFSTDELLMASMIHHKWKITDMTTIFHVSVEAIRKRKARLAHKISSKLKKDIDLDEYLANL